MNELQNINWGIIAPIIVINLILVVLAIVDCVRAERTNGPKPLWLLLILFVSIIGPVLYFVLGRRQD